MFNDIIIILEKTIDAIYIQDTKDNMVYRYVKLKNGHCDQQAEMPYNFYMESGKINEKINNEISEDIINFLLKGDIK